MAIFDFLNLGKKNAQQPEEVRSDTIPTNVVSNWESSYGYGRNIDRLSVAYGCINLLSSTIASLPVQLNRKLDKGHEAATDHIYYNLITKAPNKFQTTYSFYQWIVIQLLQFGNAYVQLIRRNDGTIEELFPMNATSVEVDVREDGLPYYRFNMVMPDGTSTYKEYNSDQILHIKGYSRNGIYGLSAVDTFRLLFDGYNELELAGTQIAKNAAKPTGVISYPGNMKVEELEKLKSGWKSGFSGTNSGKTAFLPNTLKLETANIGMTAQDAEYIEQKKFSAQRIAADIYRVPLHMMGLTTTPTYSSVEMQAIEFVTYTLNPIITNIEQQIQKQLLDDDDSVYVNFNVNSLLRGDVKTRIEYYRFALEHGVMTPNQVNEEEGTGIYIPSEKGGDDYVRPLNFAKVDNTQPVAAPAAVAAPVAQVAPSAPEVEDENNVSGSAEVESENGRSCPIETQDIGLNLANRTKAVQVANYGPANPQLPNNEFWAAKAKLFKETTDVAKTMRCANCAAFNVSQRMKDCINTGIGADANEVQAQVGELGYCELFDFKCAAARTCDAWLTGGPIRDESKSSFTSDASGSISTTT